VNLTFFSGLVLLVVGLNGLADWPAWRRNGTGISPERAVPVQWSTPENVPWPTSMPTYGWPLPVIGRDHVFRTGAVAENPGGVEPAP